VNRFGSIAGILAIFAVVTAALFFYLTQDGQDQTGGSGTEAEGTAQTSSTEATSASSSGDETIASSQGEAESVTAGDVAAEQSEEMARAASATTESGESTDGDSAAEAQGATAPAFDVVRVEPTGDTVMAGRAAPGSKVKVTDNGRDLGTVETNQSGTWVMVLEEPLAPGDHELSLSTESQSGDTVNSDSVVVVAVPEPETQMAAAEPGSDSVAAQASGNSDGAEAAAQSEGQEASGGSEPLVVLMSREGREASRVIQQALAEATKGVGQGRLILESIDYDEAGQAVIAGRAEAEARLIVYLDNNPLGTATADSLGRWELVPTRVIPAGLHELRIDQVAEDGTVLARVESPFSRADPLAELPDRTFVIVQPGNSLWRIARATYGAGVRYSVIYNANKSQIGDPDLIYPGQVFRIPQEN